MLSANQKKNIISEYRKLQSDTGTSEVQIALLTARVSYLQEHFKRHKQDLHSRRGLLRLIGQRRKLLRYLKSTHINRYRMLIGRLGLRK